MDWTEWSYLVFTILLVVIFPITQFFAKKRRLMIFIGSIGCALIYIVITICIILSGNRLEEQVSSHDTLLTDLSKRPPINEAIMSAITGFPVDMIINYNNAIDEFDSKNYQQAYENIKI